MRKSTKLIAGLSVVAGLGVALAPLSTFAVVPTRTDNLYINNTEACTINGVALDSSQEASSFTNVENNYDWAYSPGQEHDFTRRTSGTGGSENEGVFQIVCNYTTGYKIVANATNPTDGSHDIEAGTTGDEYWAARIVSKTGNIVPATGITVGTNFAITSANQPVLVNTGSSAADPGDSFSMTYAAKTSESTPAGTYEGSVAYTLVKGAN